MNEDNKHGCGGRTRTCGLRVMSPTSYQLLHPASLVGGIGFEPMKAKPADLQSAPFNHSGIRPHGAGNRTRTYDLLITNQLLYQLSYASTSVTRVIIHTGHLIVKSFHGSFLSLTPTDYSTNRRCCPPFPQPWQSGIPFSK